MVHTPRMRSLSVMIALLCLISLGAQRSCDHESRVYALTADSNFTEGCFPPLMCPTLLAEAIGGTFRLSSLAAAESGAFEEYAITDVYWLVRIGGEDIPITGSGMYRIGGVSDSQQQMVLSLRVGDAKVQVFDSGLVPIYSPGLAVIDVVISINGQSYLDTVIGVRARAFREPGETFCGATPARRSALAGHRWVPRSCTAASRCPQAAKKTEAAPVRAVLCAREPFTSARRPARISFSVNVRNASELPPTAGILQPGRSSRVGGSAVQR